MSELPACEPQYPLCGACSDELDHDGDNLICAPCGLVYRDGGGTSPAEFLDSTDKPCGETCVNQWHKAKDEGGKGVTGYAYECEPCQLPAGHTSDHWTYCKIRRV